MRDISLISKSMRRIMASLITATGLLAHGVSAQSSSPLEPGLAAKVDSIANQVLSTTGVPSASVAVVTHGGLAYAKAYGSGKLEPRVAASPEYRNATGFTAHQ